MIAVTFPTERCFVKYVHSCFVLTRLVHILHALLALRECACLQAEAVLRLQAEVARAQAEAAQAQAEAARAQAALVVCCSV